MSADDSPRDLPADPWYRTERGETNRIVFKASPRSSLGMELELQIVDAETGGLAHGAPEILARFSDQDWLKAELLQSVIELNVGPCDHVHDAAVALDDRLGQVIDAADELGYGLASAGTHPFSTWEEQEVTDDPRYQRMVDRIQWPMRRLVTFGLHVHVGVSSGEKAIAVANSLTTFLPHILALSASSPYWHGEDTGLASARTKVFESLPTAGLPYRMINWGEFQRFMNTLTNADAIRSIREVWWDIRPHPIFGTVEVRVADALPSLQESLAVAALVQCLVHRLGALYDAGGYLPTRRHWVVAENKWRAARFGKEAMLICEDGGTLARLEDQIRELVDSLEPVAEELHCHRELGAVLRMLEVGASCERQRAVYEEAGNLEAVVGSLCAELRDDDVLGSD